tara:strand:- start:28120 stop:28362 length:243 start_codon:yes stop_codon:yes gene_type:complete
MTLKTKLISLLGMVLLLPSCVSKDWASDSSVNESALYDPPTVTLIEGTEYKFKEGVLLGRKNHKYHSNYSYLRAITIGNK